MFDLLGDVLKPPDGDRECAGLGVSALAEVGTARQWSAGTIPRSLTGERAGSGWHGPALAPRDRLDSCNPPALAARLGKR